MKQVVFLILGALFFMTNFAVAEEGDWLEQEHGRPSYYTDSVDETSAMSLKGSMVSLPDSQMGGAEGDYEYVIGVNDVIEVEVFQVEDLNHTARVNTRGFISLPLIGGLNVQSKTVEETERLIEKKLAEKYLQDPHVTVFIKEYESQKITVEGWVKEPGVFPLKGKTTLLQAIAEAKGLERLADEEEITIFRTIEEGKVAGYKANIAAIRAGQTRDIVLLNNDIIVVPKHGGRELVDNITRTLRGFIGFGNPLQY